MPRSPTIVSIFLRQPRDERFERRLARCELHLGVRRVRPRVADVLGDGRMQDARLLIDERDVAPQVGRARCRRRSCAVEPDHAVVGIEQPQQQIGDRRLAAAARPDDGEHFAGARR